MRPRLSLLTVLLATLAASTELEAQTFLVSRSTAGQQGLADSDQCRVTPDGRWVVFRSAAALDPSDNNATTDVYLRDVQTSTTYLVSRGANGASANGTSNRASLSDDAVWVAFTSSASNLVPGSPPTEQVYLWNRLTLVVRLVSVNGAGGVANAACRNPEISGDGQFVAYRTAASNLGWSTGGQYQIVRCNVSTPQVTQIELVSRSITGAAAGSGVAEGHALSRDGNFVAFCSDTTNLVSGDTNGADDVFVRDMAGNVTTCASLSALVLGAHANAGSKFPRISADGRMVAFTSAATDLVPGDTNGFTDVFVHDRLTGLTARADVTSSGAQSNGTSGNVSTNEPGVAISPDGRFVSFRSSASNLDPLDTGTTPDIFLHDLQTGITRMIGLGSGGQVPSGGSSTDCSLSDQAQHVAFVSGAENLISPAPYVNSGVSDVFLRSVGDPLAPSGTCFGDGSGAACPCGNTAPAGARNGCLNSLGMGARLVATGTASIAADTLVLHADQMPNSTSLYFQGTTAVGGGAGTILGDGLGCAGGALIRLRTVQNAAGASQFPGAGDPLLSVRGSVTIPGTRVYQAWYRNAAAYCTPSTFNLTNGLVVVWQP